MKDFCTKQQTGNLGCKGAPKMLHMTCLRVDSENSQRERERDMLKAPKLEALTHVSFFRLKDAELEHIGFGIYRAWFWLRIFSLCPYYPNFK